MENDLNTSQHISKKFDQELEDVRNLVLKMGGLVEQQVANGLKALLKGDTSLAKKVIKRDRKVNALEVDIDERCTNILARRSPAATASVTTSRCCGRWPTKTNPIRQPRRRG